MKTGIELITEERKEQIEKHGFSTAHDVKEHESRDLTSCAAYLLTNDDYWYPTSWGKEVKTKMEAKTYKEKLKVAGALIAAELDRLNITNESE